MCAIRQGGNRDLFRQLISKKVRVFGRRIFVLFVAWYCFKAMGMEKKAERMYQEIHRWPVTEAVIDTTSVSWKDVHWGGYRCCPKLRYSYSIAGINYQGSNSIFDFTCWPSGYDFIAQHKPGTTIQIAYDPKDLNTSLVLFDIQRPSSPWLSCIVGVFCLALLALDLSGFWEKEKKGE